MMKNKSAHLLNSKKYLISDTGGVFFVRNDFFNEISSRNEALDLATQVYLEIQRTLKEEALTEYELYADNIKITSALEWSLVELETRYPSLLNELRNNEHKLDGQKIFQS